MQETVLNNLRFVEQFKTVKPRKTMADMLLLYYMGELSIGQTNSNVLEIGVGLSSYAMQELTKKFDQIFYAVDLFDTRLDTFCIDDDRTKSINKSSMDLLDAEVGELGYVHIDGDKNYPTTMHDLEFAYKHLDDMGMVSVNAYGLNCWPTVTHAVNSVVTHGLFEIVLVGDAAVWLVKKTSYLNWLKILKTDYEFGLLSAFLNIHNTSGLGYTPEHFFMNSIYPTPAVLHINVEDFKEYYTNLSKYMTAFNQVHAAGQTNDPGKHINFLGK